MRLNVPPQAAEGFEQDQKPRETYPD